MNQLTMDPVKAYQKYMSVKQWCQTFGYIPEGGIRHLIFSNDDFNKRVVKRLGRKVLLDVQALEEFISEQQQPATKDKNQQNQV